MITIVQGGQTGCDRGAHEAALANGWRVSGYMPRDGRDELGPIPPDVARYLIPHETASYAGRTAANVRSAGAALIVVRDAADPRTTPGTTLTIDLAAGRRLRSLVVDPKTDAALIARWIWSTLFTARTLSLPLEPAAPDPPPPRLLVAGPRESKWPGARVDTAELLRRVALALAEIPQQVKKEDLPRPQR